jgi:hypothetical protein
VLAGFGVVPVIVTAGFELLDQMFVLFRVKAAVA